MKFTRIRVQNLYSYKVADFDLLDYNIIAGPNASGKTNLLRVLNFIRGDEKSDGNIDYRRLEKDFKLDPDKKSSVILDLELSEQEAIMIMYLFFKQDGFLSIPKTFKNVTVGFFWEDTIDDNTIPISVFRLENGFTLIRKNGNDWICWLSQIPSDSINTLFETLENIHVDKDGFRSKYAQQHGFGPEFIFKQEVFLQKLMRGDPINEFFMLEDKNLKATSQIEDIRYDAPVKRYQKKIFDYTQTTKQPSGNINLWILLSKIISLQIITIKELRPNYSGLARMLFELRTIEGYASREALLSLNFSKIFPDVRYDVRQPTDNRVGPRDKEPKITIIEKDRRFPIEESAAGYFEVLYLLLNIIHARDTVLILDEPALHLHPTKIRQLGRGLLEMVENSNNQVLIITHSPYFVDYAQVTKSNNSALVYVKKENGVSEVLFKHDNDSFDLKPHLFRPEVFFSKSNILVEGAGDLAAFVGMSEGFNNILDAYDIAVIDTWGKGGIKKYIPLLVTYKIPFVAMADSDYDGPKRNVIILKGDLEDELRKLGWDPDKKYKKIDPIIAFEFVAELVKSEDGKKKIKESVLYDVLKTAIDKTGGTVSDGI